MTNKVIAMTISELEKSSNEFKKTHKIKVSGPYDDEEMPKWFKVYAEKTDARLEKLEYKLENEVPKWFKVYAAKTDARLEKLEYKLENEVPKWFKVYAEKTDARLARLEYKLENEMPKWFKQWVETDYKPFKELVVDQFEKHGWIKK